MSVLDRLRKLTNDKTWEQDDGPDSGVGIDYWFRNKSGSEAYANNDQGYLTISVDGQPIFGDMI